MIVRLLIGATVFLLAYDGGAYDVVARQALAVAVWWAVAWLLLLRVAPREPVGGWGLTAGGFLAAFTVLTGLSIAWASSNELAVLELDRTALYLGVFLLAYLLARTEEVATWSDGLALGLSAVAVLSLASRLFPGHLSHPGLTEVLPGAEARLTYPVDYWNGLGILLALAVPLLLRAATAGRSAAVRGAALVPLPVIAAAVYLTSSRGGVAVLLVGSIAFLVLTDRRWSAVVALVVGGAASAAAILVLHGRDTVVNGPLGSAAAAAEGHSAALWIALLSLAGGAVFAGLTLVPVRRPPPRAAGWALTGLAVLATIALVVAAHPVRRFDQLKQPPAQASTTNFVSAHLLSGRGNGRWQFWSSAVDEFRSRPVAGRGAGSWEAWWTQHGSFYYFTRYAHSLYLQTLGELGVIGLTLLAAGLLTAFGGAIAVRRRLESDDRVALAGVAAAFAGYAVGAALDWMWELTVVTVVAFVCLGLLARFASARGPRLAAASLRVPAIAVGVALAVAIACAAALPMLGELKVRSSEDAAARNDAVAARDDAIDAHALEPWAASPFLQLALVYERAGRVAAARSAIDVATRKDPSDWRLWLVSARIAARAGDAAAARAALAHARGLNPRSPALAG